MEIYAIITIKKWIAIVSYVCHERIYVSVDRFR